jgi:hypothetical protein
MPVQVWATWFPAQGKPQSFIQGFLLPGLHLSAKAAARFSFQIADNVIDDASAGDLYVDGHTVSWDLHYRSTFHDAQFKGLDRLLSDATFRCDFLRRDYARR